MKDFLASFPKFSDFSRFLFVFLRFPMLYFYIFLFSVMAQPIQIQKLDAGPNRYCFFNKSENLWNYVWLDKDEKFVTFFIRSKFSPKESGLILMSPPETKIIEKVEVEAAVK